MKRRDYVAALVSATTLGAAGCTSRVVRNDSPATETPPPTSTSPTRPPPSVSSSTQSNRPQTPSREIELPVEKWQLRYGGPRDSIAPVTDPAFASDWNQVAEDLSTAPPALSEEVQIIGVRRNDTTRAYPLSVLDLHEIVNDDFAGPLLVTYCPLCGSGMVAERRVAGQPTVFGNSGYTWKADLVMYDRATDSLWSQILATAIRGPQTGESLTLVPSSITTWGEWRTAYPETQVLLPPPYSGLIKGGRNTEPYELSYYVERRTVGRDPPDPDAEITRFTIVIGITANGEARAYPFPVVRDAGVINDVVGRQPIVVAVAPGDTLVAYDRRVDGNVLEFSSAGDRHMLAGDSRWALTTGRAVDGPHEGSRLAVAADQPPMFLRGWADFNPDTSLYGVDDDIYPE